ncbi:hypothetical protein [Tenacibaculum aiptasiae]|uniref:hypothetical protein n=1 Tax=Tenacibaculum aiptasiae TaxID=426481 RepID=UPI00232AF012|nr:hypothetical protein [Tenacibaculum aiptasiae]
MQNFTVKISGKGPVDKMTRQSAIEVIERKASTEALVLLAKMVEKPGASEKFVKKGNLLMTFL